MPKTLKLLNGEFIELSIKTEEGFYKAEMIHIGDEGEAEYLIRVFGDFIDEDESTLPLILTAVRDFITEAVGKQSFKEV